MSVFRNYNSNQAGGVNANALPRVYPLPWEPTQRNVRANPNIPSQPQRIQPHERGTFFGTSASGDGTLAPAMASSGSGCGCGGAQNAPVSPTATPSTIATSSSFPVSHGTIAKSVPRPQLRVTGAIRALPRSNAAPVRGTAMGTTLLGGRGVR